MSDDINTVVSPDGYAALAAEQDDEDRAYHAAMRRRQRYAPDGEGEDYAGYRNPPQYGKRIVNVECAVLHQDANGNTVPCPGYPLCNSNNPYSSANSAKPAEPLPQPESEGPQCAVCHQFGPGAVQDALEQLKEHVELHDGFGILLHVDVESLSVLITALERHHSH